MISSIATSGRSRWWIQIGRKATIWGALMIEVDRSALLLLRGCGRCLDWAALLDKGFNPWHPSRVIFYNVTVLFFLVAAPIDGVCPPANFHFSGVMPPSKVVVLILVVVHYYSETRLPDLHSLHATFLCHWVLLFTLMRVYPLDLDNPRLLNSLGATFFVLVNQLSLVQWFLGGQRWI